MLSCWKEWIDWPNSRFTVTIFTDHKNGGKLPGTKGKPGNHHLPRGKNSEYQHGFFKVKVNF